MRLRRLTMSRPTLGMTILPYPAGPGTPPGIDSRPPKLNFSWYRGDYRLSRWAGDAHARYRCNTLKLAEQVIKY